MQEETLEPAVPGKVGVYVCGPTVYSDVHIGNARTFTSFDVLVRYLRYRGFEVKYVRNYTDEDDRIIKAAHETGEEPVVLAARFVEAFLAHLYEMSRKVDERVGGKDFAEPSSFFRSSLLTQDRPRPFQPSQAA